MNQVLTSRSSFGNCTSLRRQASEVAEKVRPVAVPSGTALHEACGTTDG